LVCAGDRWTLIVPWGRGENETVTDVSSCNFIKKAWVTVQHVPCSKMRRKRIAERRTRGKEVKKDLYTIEEMDTARRVDLGGHAQSGPGGRIWSGEKVDIG